MGVSWPRPHRILCRNGRCAVSPDGAWVVKITAGHGLLLWQSASGLCISATAAGTPHQVCIGRKGVIVTVYSDTTARVWILQHALGRPEWELRPGPVLHGHTQTIEWCGVSPSAHLVATRSRDGTVRVWSSKTGVCVRVVHREHAFGPCVLTSRGLLTTGGGIVRRWPLPRGPPQIMFCVSPRRTAPSALAATTSGTLVVMAAGRTVCVWGAASRRVLQILHGHEDRVTCVAISDGIASTSTPVTEHDAINLSLVCSVAFDRTVRLWDVRTGACLHMQRLVETPRHCALSREGRILSIAPDSTQHHLTWRLLAPSHVRGLLQRDAPDLHMFSHAVVNAMGPPVEHARGASSVCFDAHKWHRGHVSQRSVVRLELCQWVQRATPFVVTYFSFLNSAPCRMLRSAAGSVVPGTQRARSWGLFAGAAIAFWRFRPDQVLWTHLRTPWTRYFALTDRSSSNLWRTDASNKSDCRDRPGRDRDRPASASASRLLVPVSNRVVVVLPSWVRTFFCKFMEGVYLTLLARLDSLLDFK